MDANTKEHYDGWKEKYESIEGDSLNSVFERFTTYTLFIIDYMLRYTKV